MCRYTLIVGSIAFALIWQKQYLYGGFFAGLLLATIFMVVFRNWKWKRQEQINAYYKMRLGRTLPIAADLGKHRRRRFW